MVREVLKKQPAISITTIMGIFKIETLGTLTLMDTDSFACACGIQGLVDPEQKKGNLKLLLKYILRQFNSEDAKGFDNRGYFWYTKLHDHLE